MTQNADLAGKYAAHPQGYQAFIPTPLPPEPSLAVDSEMQSLLSKADRALDRLDGCTIGYATEWLPVPEKPALEEVLTRVP